jgi:hypothetical protein
VAEAEVEDVAVAATWEVQDSAVAGIWEDIWGDSAVAGVAEVVVEGTPEECILEVESTSVEG